MEQQKLDYTRCAKGGVSAGKAALAKAIAKNRFNPSSTPLNKGDVILFNVLDKEKKMPFIEDANGGTYLICTLIRKGRKKEYNFYPSTLVRYYQKWDANVRKSESDDYIFNEGDVPTLIGTESIEAYADENMRGAAITIRDIHIEFVWKFKKFVRKDEYTDDDFKKSKGTLYKFGIEYNKVPEAEMVILEKTIEEIVKEMNEPQVS